MNLIPTEFTFRYRDHGVALWLVKWDYEPFVTQDGRTLNWLVNIFRDGEPTAKYYRTNCGPSNLNSTRYIKKEASK